MLVLYILTWNIIKKFFMENQHMQGVSIANSCSVGILNGE
jgi:hypothetical protein